MPFDADALDKIVEIASVDIVEVSGQSYHVSSEGAQLIRPPTQKSIKCFSLAQLLGMVKADEPSEENNKILINVTSPFRVDAFSVDTDECFERDQVAHCDFAGVLKLKSNGERMSQEDFIINLQSMFMPNDDLSNLLKLVSAVKAARVLASDDDGVSQQVAANAGVHLVTELKVKNPWMLKPFMTFPEIEPVEIVYLLRLHQRSDELPQFALYECDGGRWQIKTIKAIIDYLNQGVEALDLKGVTVL